MKKLALAVTLAALTPFPASAQQQHGKAGSTGSMEKKIKPEEALQWFYDANQFEVKVSQLASRKAVSPQVKQFAEMMMSDHQNTMQKIEQVAKDTKLSYKGKPTTTPADKPWRQTQQDVYDTMDKLPPDRFDSAFLAAAVLSHDIAIWRVETAYNQMQSAQGTEKQAVQSQLVQLFSQALPTLRQHRQQAYQLLGQTGAASASSERMGTMPGMGTTPPSGQGSARTGSQTPPQPYNR